MQYRFVLLNIFSMLIFGTFAHANSCGGLLNSSNTLTVEIRVKPSEERSFDHVLGLLEGSMWSSKILYSLPPSDIGYVVSLGGVEIGPRQRELPFTRPRPLPRFSMEPGVGIIILRTQHQDLELLVAKNYSEITQIDHSDLAEALGNLD